MKNKLSEGYIMNKLEQDILAHWKSIPNDSSIPAIVPTKIKIIDINNGIVLYEKLVSSNKKNEYGSKKFVDKVFGRGCINLNQVYEYEDVLFKIKSKEKKVLKSGVNGIYNRKN